MTPELSPSDFAAFFAAVHGVAPFPWQERLLRQVAAEGHWPDLLDLPTGTGKTAALDIALFHLALEADKGADRCAPVRIAFVVDRRLIVDDAHARAQKIAKALAMAAAGDAVPQILRKVAVRLGSLAERPEVPLLARRLRGGMPREDDWARTPAQPTILCSTVDQVGSRLLFRGYGISDRMKPVHAGLLGSDCLILLDEAHLAEPFRQTLDSVNGLRGERNRQWHVATLTATPGMRSRKIEFALQRDDWEHPVLSRRLGASKPAGLVEIPRKQGVAIEDRRIDEITEQTLQTIRKLRATMPSPAVGVVVNRVARARAVFEALRKRLADELPEAEAILVIGPARQAERERLAIDLEPIRTAGGEPRALKAPLVVVATQTIEAGVDIDFDGLVTEAAPLDALRQRFGRLNRAGRRISPMAAILAHPDDVGAKADDPVYGDRIAATWQELLSTGQPHGGLVDFGIEAFPAPLLDAAAQLISPRSEAPILMPAYVELWSQTWPVPAADPETALFLHGPDRSPASVQLVWRADVCEADLSDRDHVLVLLRLVPPRSAEAIELPLWAVRAWLRNQGRPLANLSDAADRAPEESDTSHQRRVFRYAGDDTLRSQAVRPGEIQAGDLIVAPADYGGCDQWGWHPASTASARDVAEIASRPYRGRRYAVRVTSELICQWWSEDSDCAASGLIPEVDRIEAELKAALAPHREERDARVVLDAILALSLPQRLREMLLPLHQGNYRGRLAQPHFYIDAAGEPRGVVFLVPFGLTELGGEEESVAPPATESDDIGLASGRGLLLNDHSCGVREYARKFAEQAGLPPEIASDVALAAYLHDAGKADPRFQAMLYGGDWFAVDESRVLAKSPSGVARDAAERAGLPRHWRHEALSVRMARTHPRFEEASDKKLVLWLIGVHHGYGRPFFPHCDPYDERDRDDLFHIEGLPAPLLRGAGPQSLAFSFEGCDWAEIFDRLRRRYGVWELARIEAIVRLADHRASEARDRSDKL